MKQIIFPISATSDVITEADAKRNLNPLIGLVFPSGSKGFLLKSEYKSHTYMAMAVDFFEKGNRWTNGSESAKTLGQWFDFFNNNGITSPALPKWFSFDTPKELFAWLAE